MNRFISAALIALVSLGLASCSAYNPHYHHLNQRPSGNWQGASPRWGGFTEHQQSDQRYQIGFEAYNRPNLEAAKYFTLVRSAERAAIDGQRHFYATPASGRTTPKRSHFAAYTKPGYHTTHIHEYETFDHCGHSIWHTEEITTWHPPRHFPAREVINQIYKAKRTLSYSQLSAPRYDTYQVLREAHLNTRGYGKVKLDPRAKSQMDAWVKAGL